MSDVHTSRKISHEEARESLTRLCNSHFNREPHARVSIPARPDYDDDLILGAYIKQQIAQDAPARNAILEEAAEQILALRHF